ncbi:hypothetical protein GQ44DRAFT_701862 [Phaeosphaeriaceae sp. PMI808]|nr:hypothetical protein GQ44DRAFT_701862 [Phaeosphaeriaceae sp. PMI808]
MDAMHKTPSEQEIASTLSQLKLSTKVPQKPAQKPKSKPVADSWDEGTSDSDTETENEPSKASATSPRDSLEPISTVASNESALHPPPPTPASPTPFDFADTFPRRASSSRADTGTGRGDLDKRPEKTTAVAGRMIAGALGVRAPKRTDEEKEYDKAMREKERRRRTEEKEREKREKEETEARKKAIWDD